MNVTHRFIQALVLAWMCHIPAQAEIHLTLYPGKLALVQESRSLDAAASDHIRLTGVPSSLIPETLRLQVNGKMTRGHRLLTRTATRTRLLQSHLGQSLELVRIDPNSGRETRLNAKLIGVDGANAIIQNGEGTQVIDGRSPWRLIFPTNAGAFVERPTLEALLAEQPLPGARLDMRYLATGLDWSASYSADLNASMKHMDLTAWATLSNQTDIDFRQARVALIAGAINRVAPTPMRTEKRVMAHAMMADAAMPVATPVGGYHRYTLPSAITLGAGESLQRLLLRATDIPVKVIHRLAFGNMGGFWRPMRANGWRPADMSVTFKNDQRGPNRALPAGRLRAYLVSSDRGDTLLGETRLGNMTRGDQVRLDIGKAFDVKGRRIQKTFKRHSKRESESSWLIRLRNGGDSKVDLLIEESMPELWEVLEAKPDYSKPDARTLRWKLNLGAGEEREIRYRIVVRQR